MVKYSPVSIISLSLIRMPASDNPYKSLRAIPYLKYRLNISDETPNLYPLQDVSVLAGGWPGAY